MNRIESPVRVSQPNDCHFVYIWTSTSSYQKPSNIGLWSAEEQWKMKHNTANAADHHKGERKTNIWVVYHPDDIFDSIC